ncbi:hypothetical protein DM01DRAFT_1335578 [Hesseltinella vesiculosa]|uniref:Uncharacterized protein n=1 Tax=Hesseltinella vesiculosa TaxID=101127 RepID=A0A1X2GIA3_9FUNG|nr:hypothetical protein DM01DRAFT_1335578 [Hesseltinella vesiculosa]
MEEDHSKDKLPSDTTLAAPTSEEHVAAIETKDGDAAPELATASKNEAEDSNLQSSPEPSKESEQVETPIDKDDHPDPEEQPEKASAFLEDASVPDSVEDTAVPTNKDDMTPVTFEDVKVSTDDEPKSPAVINDDPVPSHNGAHSDGSSDKAVATDVSVKTPITHEDAPAPAPAKPVVTLEDVPVPVEDSAKPTENAASITTREDAMVSVTLEEATPLPEPTVTVTDIDVDPYHHQPASAYDDDVDDDDEHMPSYQPTFANQQVQQQPAEATALSSDTSHKKGFQNASDMDQIVELNVSGKIPDWLIGEHYTVGPGVYDVKYLRKVEIDGEIQHASSYFSFGHWFDALPLLNRFDINGTRNTISYRNRLPNARLVDRIRDHHGYTPPYPGSVFNTKSNQTFISKFMKASPKASRPDGEICGARLLPSLPGMVGRLFAQNSAKHIQELDPFDLRPTKAFTWDEVNPQFKGYSSSANGHMDQHTGEYINFTMEVGYQSSQYHVFSISDREPQGSVLATVQGPTAFMNDIVVTSKYIVLILYPFLANTSGMKYSWNESVLDSFSFDVLQPTLFYVISRETRQLMSVFKAPATLALHHVNAFEDLEQRGHNLILDLVCYKDDTILHQLSTDSLRSPEAHMVPSRIMASEVRRYTLVNIEEEHLVFAKRQSSTTSSSSSSFSFSAPANTNGAPSGKWASALGNFFRSGAKSASATSKLDVNQPWLPNAQIDRLLPPSLELPQIHPHYRMYPYQYMYGLGFSAASSIQDGQIWDSIVKADVVSKDIVATWHEEHCYPSEAMFMARDGSQQEDDGVLVSVVMDSARATSFLLILDALQLQELARADLGMIVPISFAHGTYRLQ